MKKYILGAIAIIIIIAVIKNPSESESKQLIIDMAIEKVYGNSFETAESDDEFEKAGKVVALLLAPQIIDNMVDITVDDYIVFSSFSVKTTIDEQKKNLVAGIIIFGKVIPLSSEVGAEYI